MIRVYLGIKAKYTRLHQATYLVVLDLSMRLFHMSKLKIHHCLHTYFNFPKACGMLFI